MWIKETHTSVYRDAIYFMKLRVFIISISSLFEDEYSSKVDYNYAIKIYCLLYFVVCVCFLTFTKYN